MFTIQKDTGTGWQVLDTRPGRHFRIFYPAGYFLGLN